MTHWLVALLFGALLAMAATVAIVVGLFLSRRERRAKERRGFDVLPGRGDSVGRGPDEGPT